MLQQKQQKQKAQQVWMRKSLRSSRHQLSILQRKGSLSFDTCQMSQANVRVEYLHWQHQYCSKMLQNPNLTKCRNMTCFKSPRQPWSLQGLTMDLFTPCPKLQYRSRVRLSRTDFLSDCCKGWSWDILSQTSCSPSRACCTQTMSYRLRAILRYTVRKPADASGRSVNEAIIVAFADVKWRKSIIVTLNYLNNMTKHVAGKIIKVNLSTQKVTNRLIA